MSVRAASYQDMLADEKARAADPSAVDNLSREESDTWMAVQRKIARDDVTEWEACKRLAVDRAVYESAKGKLVASTGEALKGVPGDNEGLNAIGGRKKPEPKPPTEHMGAKKRGVKLGAKRCATPGCNKFHMNGPGGYCDKCADEVARESSAAHGAQIAKETAPVVVEVEEQQEETPEDTPTDDEPEVDPLLNTVAQVMAWLKQLPDDAARKKVIRASVELLGLRSFIL